MDRESRFPTSASCSSPCVLSLAASTALAAVRETKKKVIAMKPLAMGRLAPREGMAYVCRIPDVDGIVVGIGHEYEAEETFGAAREMIDGRR